MPISDNKRHVIVCYWKVRELITFHMTIKSDVEDRYIVV